MAGDRWVVKAAVVLGVWAAGWCNMDEAAAGAGAAVLAASSAPQATGAAEHEEGVHKPNVMTIDPDLAIFTAIVFLMLLAVLWKFAWGPISEALDRREGSIASQIEEAKRSNEESKRLLAEHQAHLNRAADEVKGLLDQARRDADSQRQHILAEAQRAAAAERDRALREIGAAKNQALHDLTQHSVDAAVELAGRIVGRELTPESHAELIRETLPQLRRGT
jgi:F-type H+-transporting ATPase subunit b